MGVFTGLFFLVLPVRWLMELDNLSYRTTYTWKEWCDLFIYRNVDSDLLLTSVCFAGVLCAIYHFAYLHSGKKMDFYGSFPIRRDQMFRHKVIFGYIDFVIPYTVMLGKVIILGVSKNFVTGKSIVTFLMLWGADQLIFLLVYLVSALAMILTGKIVIGILGSGVLLYFGMFADLIFNQYVRSFFETSVMEYGYGKGAYFSAFATFHTQVLLYFRIQKAFVILFHSDCMFLAYLHTCLTSTTLLFSLIQYHRLCSFQIPNLLSIRFN